VGLNPNSFYVTLFSNSLTKAYPDNTIGAFTVQLAHELDLGTNRWEVAICEFSCPPPKVDTIKSHVVVGDTHTLIYCDLITPQFVSHLKARCLRTFIHPTALCNQVFKTCITCPSKSKYYERLLFKYSTMLGTRSPSRVARHLRRSFYISDAFFN